jgi:iron complex outermembrane receptor protein
MTFKSRLMIGVGLVALAAEAGPALAQQPVLEEIVVTAQRREQNLQQAPVAVTAFTASELEKAQVNAMIDLSSRAPNLFISNASASPATVRTFLRGAGQNDNTIPTAEQSVGFYVDDIYQARGNALNTEFFDVERIEVLRGPQGTLYGRNTAVGAIKIVTQVPDGETTGKADVSYGRYSEFRTRGTFAFPIVDDKLAASLSGIYMDRGGDRFNTVLGRKVNERKYGGLRGVFHYTPSDNLDIVFRAFWTRDKNQHNSVVAASDLDGRPLIGDYFRVTVPFLPFGRTQQNGFNGKLTYDLANDWTLEYIGSYLSLTDDSFADVSGGQRLATGTFRSNFNIATELDNDQMSHELKVAGDAADGKLRAAFGAYYFRETTQGYLDSRIIPQAIPPLPLPFVVRNVTNLDLATDAYAFFGQGTYYVTEQLGVTVGGRISWDKKDATADFTASQTLPVAGTAPTTRVTTDKTFKEFTPKFGLEYQADDDLFLFANAAKGFKGGGFNGRGNTATIFQATFNEETVWTYEAGVKSELMDNRLRVNATYFLNKFNDLQLQAFVGSAGAVATSNAGKARVHGLELETTYAATDDLTLRASIATMSDKYTRVDPTSDVATNRATELPTTPSFESSVGFDWSIPSPDVDGTLDVGATYTHRASFYPGTVQTFRTLTKAQDLVDARLTWMHEDEQFSVTVSGRNLLDKHYPFATLFVAGVVNAKYPAERRMWHISARYTY